jgi:hypothetical protein
LRRQSPAGRRRGRPAFVRFAFNRVTERRKSDQLAKTLALLATLAALGAACSDKSKPSTPPTVASSTSEASTDTTCPVTIANLTVPPDATDWGPEDSHGNGKLWTIFWPHGVIVADSGYVERDGSIGMKWPWWRGVDGTLTIEGRRLDATAPPLRADLSTADSYGESGFQPSGIYFSTEGCWEVTGRVGQARLTFVTLVVKASTYALELKTN